MTPEQLRWLESLVYELKYWERLGRADALRALLAERDRMRGALAVYADPNNWGNGEDDRVFLPDSFARAPSERAAEALEDKL